MKNMDHYYLVDFFGLSRNNDVYLEYDIHVQIL